MQIGSVRGREANGRALEPGTCENRLHGNLPVQENLSLPVHIPQERLECAKPLPDALFQEIPFRLFEDMRQDVAQPSLVRASRESERGAHFPQNRLQSLVQTPNFRTRQAIEHFQYPGIYGARAAFGVQHLMPANRAKGWRDRVGRRRCG